MQHCTALVLMFLALVTVIVPIAHVSGTTYSVGVKVGDWAKYTIVGAWKSNVTVDAPQFVKDALNTEWIRIDVTKISGTTVTLIVTTQFNNSTEKINHNIGDIRTGSGNLSLQLIAANLAYGDQVSESQELFVSNTTSKVYAGAMRDVNYASTEGGNQYGGSEAAEFYWDRITGIIVGTSLVETYESTFTAIASIITKMTETSIWQSSVSTGIASDWIAAAATIFVLAIVLIIILTIRKPKKRLRSRHARTSKVHSSFRLFSTSKHLNRYGSLSF